jgi:exodeoxyribonuclease VII small subunit
LDHFLAQVAKKSNAVSVAPTQNIPTLGTFETEFERLNAIVGRLENGSVTLEEMLKLYEQGVHLAGALATLLSEAELRVEKLSQMHEEMSDDVDDEAEEEESDSIETYLLE